MARIQNILEERGYLSHQFTSHSLRIRSALVAAQVRIKEYVAQMVG